MTEFSLTVEIQTEDEKTYKKTIRGKGEDFGALYYQAAEYLFTHIEKELKK